MWEVLLKGSFKKKEKEDALYYELSVIKKDNKHGHRSWGWGGLNKIILFDANFTNPVDEPDDKDVEFMMFCAHSLCDSLNKSEKYKEV